jgi:uncharacterized protein (DUF1800 family)
MSAVVGNLTNNPEAAQAFTRFGFGGRPDDVIPANPMDWLAAQITCADEAPSGQSTRDALILAYEAEAAPPGSTSRAQLTEQVLGDYQAEAQSFLSYAATTRIPFRERLVWFWSNHFAVIADRGLYALACAGPYIRDFIRPYMTGTVSQMLQAAILSPAMLESLNGETSVGPQSTMAINAAKRGVFLDINENLGRETLELYTLGYDNGYTQADVDALAYLLSGIDVNGNPAKPYGAYYNPLKQQPGNVTLMGTTYPCTISGLVSALHMLGTHPNTYLHLATKLVTQFVSDTPSSADIQTVYTAFATTGGSLPAAHQAVIGLQDAWVPLQKFRTPADLCVAALRAVGATAANMNALMYSWPKSLGQPVWCPPFPNGWSDLAEDWNGPAAMMLRADWAWWFSGTISGSTPSEAVLASVAPFLSAKTANAITDASSVQEQFLLLFCSPEFQRR